MKNMYTPDHLKDTDYMERARTAILNFGYDFVALRSRAKRLLQTKIRILENNVSHYA